MPEGNGESVGGVSVEVQPQLPHTLSVTEDCVGCSVGVGVGVGAGVGGDVGASVGFTPFGGPANTWVKQKQNSNITTIEIILFNIYTLHLHILCISLLYLIDVCLQLSNYQTLYVYVTFYIIWIEQSPIVYRLGFFPQVFIQSIYYTLINLTFGIRKSHIVHEIFNCCPGPISQMSGNLQLIFGIPFARYFQIFLYPADGIICRFIVP